MRLYAFLFCFLFSTVLSLPAHAATFSITEPSGQTEKIFTIRATALADQGGYLGYMKAYINGTEVQSVSCNNGVCEIAHTMELCTGTYTLSLAAQESGVWINGPSQTFTVDGSPSITLSQPSGAIIGSEVRVTGEAAFKPSNSTSVTRVIRFYVDSSTSSAKDITCYGNSTSCPFDFTIGVGHGPHTIKAVVSICGETAETQASFSVDMTPLSLSVQPVAVNNDGNLSVKGSTTFAPSGNPARWGTVVVNLDGVQVGSKACYGVECPFDLPVMSMGTPGNHAIEVKSVAWSAPVQLSNTQTFSVNTFKEKDAPKQGDVCLLSSTNVQTGSLKQQVDLFQTNAGGGIPLSFSLYYDSNEILYIPPQKGYRYAYRLPHNKGWSHTYDLWLYQQAAGEMVLRGGGFHRRFYTPTGNGYISQAGDSSVLVKNSNNTYTLTEREGTVYSFDTTGRLSSVKDRFNNTLTASAISNRQQTITDSNGRSITLAWDYYNERIVSFQDPDGNTHTFTYNTTGLLTGVSSPVTGGGNRTWGFSYDPSFRLMTSKTDPAGNLFSYTWDSGQRLVQATGPTAYSKEMSYSTGITALADEDAVSKSYLYDANNKLSGVTATGETEGISYTYDASNRVASETTALDGSTKLLRTYAYDAYGNLTASAAYPIINNTTGSAVENRSFTYDNAHYDRITSATDLLANLTTTYVYDLDGSYERIRITDPAGGLTTLRRNTNGTLKDAVYPDGRTLTYAYNSNKVVTSITDSTGPKVVFSNFTGTGRPGTVQLYDSANNLKQTTTVTYDKQGRVIKTSDGGSGGPYETTSSFNNLDALTSIQDGNGNSTTYSNNFKGLPTTITNALQKATILTYSGAGRPTSLQDANGNTTSYQYNSKGWLAKEIWPVGAAIRYEYDLGGRVTAKINDSTGSTIVSYDYDVLGRVTGRSYADGSDSFTYDAAGRLVTASNQNISYTFSYDTAGRLASQTDNNGNVISYAYDTASRRTSTTILANGDQHTIGYAYSNSRPATITSSKAGQFAYTYDGLGRRSTVSYPNGITGTYSYHADQPGWLSGINYGSAYSVSYPSFDKVGNRLSKYDGIGTSYSYDAVYRLLTSTAGESFSYDNAGNRLTEAAKIYTITAGNVMATAGSTSYTYDDLGNTVTAGAWAYGWNGAGKLSTAVSGTTNASYTYDPLVAGSVRRSTA